MVNQAQVLYYSICTKTTEIKSIYSSALKWISLRSSVPKIPTSVEKMKVLAAGRQRDRFSNASMTTWVNILELCRHITS